MSRTPSLRAFVAAAVAVPALWLLVNAARPLAYDDPQFLTWARAISPMPGDSVPACTNWESYGETLADAYAHYPPGWAILLAGMRRITGESPFGLRLLQWPFAAAFLLGVALLAARTGASPWAAFWLAASSPLFVLTGATVMPDLACVAAAVLGLALWTAGDTRSRIAAGVLLAVSGQLKQNALPLFGLLLLPDPGGRRPRLRDIAIAAAAGILACAYPPVEPRAAMAGGALAHARWVLAWAWEPALLLPKFAYLLALAAALAVFPAAWIAARAPGGSRPSRWLAGVAAVFALSLAGAWKFVPLPGGSVAPVPPGAGALWFFASIALLLGWAWGALPAAAKSREGRWWIAWIVLVAAGYMAGAPFPAARFLIALLPPLAVLLARGLAERRAVLAVVVAGNLWLSLSLAHGDNRLASFLRDAAGRGALSGAGCGLQLVTNGQWGFRYYVERAGGRVLAAADEELPRGAALLAPATIPHLPTSPTLEARCVVVEAIADEPSVLQRSVFPFRPLASRAHSASFQGGHCWLPYALSRGSVETVTVYCVKPLRSRRR